MKAPNTNTARERGDSVSKPDANPGANALSTRRQPADSTTRRHAGSTRRHPGVNPTSPRRQPDIRTTQRHSSPRFLCPAPRKTPNARPSVRLFYLDEHQLRRTALTSRFTAAKLDSLLVNHLPSVRYLTGFTGSNGILLVTPERTTLFTDPRYTTQAAQECSCRVRITKGRSMTPAVSKAIAKEKLRKIGFAAGGVSVATHDFLKEKLTLGAELVKADPLVETQRMVKSPSEIEAIRRAVHTTSRAFANAMKHMKTGMTEADLAAEIDHQARRAGAESLCFETIVATGERAALPHARPTSAPIKRDQLLLIDMGACQNGYASDMTRTVGIGQPPRRLRSAYQIVLDSQLAALDAVRPGVCVAKVDQAARKVLQPHQLEKMFVHSLGHGLGLEIHEAPRLGRGEKTRLEAGMVITVEPGVYLPGDYGIRIEDTVLVTATGCEVLTPTSKSFQTY